MADISNVEVVFVKPVRFEDCVNVARYIKEDKIVNVGNKVFCSIPKGKEYLNETQKETRGSSTEEEEEEIVPAKRR